MDVLFVNPGCRESVYQALGSSLTAIEPPQWCGLMAEFMRSRDFSVKICDAEALHMNPEDTAKAIANEKPTLTVIVVYGHQPSASSQTMSAAGEICSYLKQSSAQTKTIIIGGHVSALPERTLQEEDADYICEGEGPYTVLNLVEHLQGKKDVAEVPGLWYRGAAEIRHNAKAPLIQDLDKDLPRVAWDLLPMEKYRAHNWHCFGTALERQPYANIYTSLGCPFRCTFCCINAPFGKPGFRMRSPKAVVDEMEHLVRTYGVRNIKITDEMFVLNEKHVNGICDLIIERGLDLNIWAYARVDTVQNVDLLKKMKQAGINWLALGIESGSAFVRDGVEKAFTIEDIVASVHRVQDIGIYVLGNFIFGLPDDNKETMEETLQLAIDLNCDFSNFYSAMAYPGSNLYNVALEKGWELPKVWHGYSQHSDETLPLPTHHLSAGEVLEFRDNAFHRYFSHAKYLEHVSKTFGQDITTHIAAMATHRLKRKYAQSTSTCN